MVHTHIHTLIMEYYLAIENNEILSFATTWVGPTGYYAVRSGRENPVCYHWYMESKKWKRINIAKQKKPHRYREQVSC